MTNIVAMLELKKSYKALFLGRQLLSGAVTSDLLCRLVHDVPETITAQDYVQCIVQCNTSGLSVSRAIVVIGGTDNGGRSSELLEVPLCDILFCHVDKGRPEVTVWVIRCKEDESTGSQYYGSSSSGSLGIQPILQAYIYRCLNQKDAFDLFKVYNEINRQAKFDKYRRNVEKKEVGGFSHLNLINEEENSCRTQPNGSVIDFDNSSTIPVPIVLSTTNVKTEVMKFNPMVAVVISSSLSLSASSTSSQQEETVIMQADNPSPTRSSIVGNIASYRRSFRIIRPRDKDIRATLLEELREKLVTRENGNCGESFDIVEFEQANSVKSKPENRQRKPVKIVAGTVDCNRKMTSLDQPRPIVSNKSMFQFSWSNAMKKLVQKKRNNGYATTSMSQPITLPIPESHTPVWYLPRKDTVTKAAVSSSQKGAKSRSQVSKGPGPNPLMQLIGTSVDPYFCLPPLSMIHEANSSLNTRKEVYVSLPNNLALVQSQSFPINETKNVRSNKACITVTTPSFKALSSDACKDYSFPMTHRYCNENQHNHDHHHYNHHHGKGLVNTTGMVTRSNKKVKLIYRIGRFTRANYPKKRTPSGKGSATFYRTLSSGSRRCTSSESGPDDQLRSVMKKPKQTSENTLEQKKNVTFHAYATVQVLN